MEAAFDIVRERLAGLLVMAMVATPFFIWTVRSIYRATVTGESAYPGHGRTFWLVVLPLAIVVYGVVRGFDNRDPWFTYIADENGQMLFMMVPGCLGIVFGYCAGLLYGIANRKG
ncbi:MAG: hypothetical protein WBF87_11515 [Mesorhizobium sp.]